MPDLDPVGEATLESLVVGLVPCGVGAREPELDPLGDITCWGVADLDAGLEPPCCVGGFASWGVAALEPCFEPCGVACLEPTGVADLDPCGVASFGA